MRAPLLAASALVLLASCATDPSRPGVPGEAGAAATGSGFGNATMNNVLIHSGQLDAAMALSQRFAAEVPSTITFAFDSAALDSAAQAALTAQAQWINAFPEVRFAVYGHTDLVGSAAYNEALGLRRAQSAVAFLILRGVHPSRLEALVSQGETMPLIATQAPERANRRTVTDVRGFVQSHSGVLNGKYAEVIFRDYVASAGTPATTQGITGSELATDQ